MLASTFMDLVVGADIHFEMVPMPAPVPTPIPHPFMGMIFDPLGMAANLIVSNVIDMAKAGAITPPKGPVLINFLPATNTGTDCKNKMVLPHIPLPPGTAWTPMPKAPKPKIGAHGTPTPDAPVAPAGDAVLMMGSKTVSIMGSNAVRMGDVAMSCSEPVRMPSSQVIAIPKGPPVMIGGPPAIDWMQAAGALLRSKWVANELHGLLSKIKNARLRDLLGKVVCFVTGHPVDVATGRLLTWMTDWELPGPIPVTFERNYSSSRTHSASVLGPGWSHSFDQAVWLERGRVVYRCDEGREIEFDTFDLPDHVMRVGDQVYDRLNRLTLRCRGPFHFEIEGADGLTRVFQRQPAEANTLIARLVRIASPAGHTVQLEYDAQARLEWLRDSGGRLVRFEYDRAGRLFRIALPHPSADGWLVHTEYRYSPEGDLAAAVDPLGNQTRYEYAGHLMVRETDRTGLSFYFGYDGTGADARCIRTWGDGGIFDHELVYDVPNHKTCVTNSMGETTLYEADALNLVRKVTDPLGQETTYDYDDALRPVKKTLPDGSAREVKYDARGNRIEVVAPDGGKMTFAYAGDGLPVHAVMPTGAEWSWRYDAQARLIEARDPLGHARRYEYDRANGMMSAYLDQNGARTRFAYDPFLELSEVTAPDGAVRRYVSDRLGRVVEERDERGTVTRTQVDPLGRPLRVERRGQATREFAYDGEGNPVRIALGARVIELSYTGRHRVAERREAGASVRFAYDTEDRIAAVINEAGERWSVARDEGGRVVREFDFDGTAKDLKLDACGRVVAVARPSGAVTKIENDPMGRPTKITFADGSENQYAYREDGMLVAASNAHAQVKLERDPLGRVLREVQGDHWVESAYDPAGRRVRLRTSLGLDEAIDLDAHGQPLRVALRQGGSPAWQVEFQRDPGGAETRRSFPGGEVITQRDDAGQPVLQRIVAGGVERHARAFGWDQDGALARTLDAASGPTTFQRDPRGRLAEAARPGAPAERLMPDATGNLTGGPRDDDRAYGPGGRILRAGDVRYQHDADGQLVEAEAGGDRRWRYGFGASGLLERVVRPDGDEVTFAYDALGRRVSKTSGQRGARFVWDGNTPVHELSSAQGTVSWVFEPNTVYPLARQSSDGTVGVVRDYLGTPEALVRDDGRVQTVAFGATGLPVEGATAATTELPWRFAGQYADEETGLHYNRFRYYDPQLGRYLSKDPLGVLGGLNVYAYVADPTAAIDPFGLVDEYGIERMGSSAHRGDGRDAHELLQSAWLKENAPGYTGRSSGFGRDNPAMALDPAVHDAITRAQAKAGLHDATTLAAQTAEQNIRANAKILKAELIAQGFSKKEAAAIVKDFEEQATEFAEKNKCV